MGENLAEARVTIDNISDITFLFGNRDVNVKCIEEEFKVRIVTRGGDIAILGDEKDVESVQRLLNQLLEMLQNGNSLTINDVKYFVKLAKNGEEDKITDLYNGVICHTHRGKPIKPKTIGQKIYTDAIKRNDIVFGIGPAG